MPKVHCNTSAVLEEQFTLRDCLLGDHDPGRHWKQYQQKASLYALLSFSLICFSACHSMRDAASSLKSPALAVGKSTLKVSVKVFMTILVDCVLGGRLVHHENYGHFWF